MNPQREELERALVVLRESTGKGQPVNHYHARALLLPLGACLAEGPVTQDRDEVRLVQAAVGRQAAAWKAAVAEEMELAVTEIVRSADPRFVLRADYDWSYVREARRRIDDRLRGLQALGLPFDPLLARQLADADRRLGQT